MNTVGYVMPFAHAKVVDREGRTLSIGQRGELCMAGYQLQRGYWKNQEKTDEVMVRDDSGVLWLKTGDEAIINEDKTCTITGRFKDIIIRGKRTNPPDGFLVHSANENLLSSGGENIYPLEIEERLLQHDAISKAIVIGVKHNKYGEVVAAFLQRTEGSKNKNKSPLSDGDIREWVRMTLGRHKAPEHVFWLGEAGIPSSIPLTGSGKVRKFEFVKLAEQVLLSQKAKL